MDLDKARCAAYIPRKKRYCKNPPLEGSMYCHNHQNYAPSDEVMDKDPEPIKLGSKRFNRWLNKLGFREGITIAAIIGAIFLLISLPGDLSDLIDLFNKDERTAMDGEFRIAVAEFTVVGDSRNSDTGFVVANILYERLVQELAQFDSGIRIQKWGPAEVDKRGNVTGTSPEQLAESAENLAVKIETDILVYGMIDASGNDWEIQPYFFVAEKNFYDAQEIIGQHDIGMAFVIPEGNSTTARVALGSELTERVNLLSQVTLGLAYYALEAYQSSLDTLLQAETIEGLSPEDGLQVLYLLIGNAAGKVEDAALSEAYNLKALEIDPEYSRAHIGLASSYYLRGIQQNPVDVQLLEEAIQQYLTAIDAKNQPELADIPAKAHFGIGQTLFVLKFLKARDSYDPAIAELEKVIAIYGDGANPRVQHLAGEAHGRLGRIYLEMNMSDKALVEFETAVELLDSVPSRQEIYVTRVAETQTAIDEDELKRE